MNIKDTILIIEDEQSILRFMMSLLKRNGYRVLSTVTGADALVLIESHCPDLIILDLGLPDIDGISILRKLRTWSNTPVIVVSARTMEKDKVLALDLNADDYITKPFGTGEFLARIRLALRHARKGSTEEVVSRGTYSVRDLVIDYNKHQVLLNGKNINLTQAEYKIVALLGQYAGRVLTYDTIMKELWGPRAGRDNRILRVNMANIRRKIEKNPAKPEYLFTEIGVGYRIADE